MAKPEEELAALVVGVIAVGAVLTHAGTWWEEKAGPWLVRYAVLARPVDDPLLEVPGLHGAGLDLPRIAIAAAGLIAIAAASVARRSRSRQDQP